MQRKLNEYMWMSVVKPKNLSTGKWNCKCYSIGNWTFLKTFQPFIHEASSVLTHWRGVAGF